MKTAQQKISVLANIYPEPRLFGRDLPPFQDQLVALGFDGVNMYLTPEDTEINPAVLFHASDAFIVETLLAPGFTRDGTADSPESLSNRFMEFQALDGEISLPGTAYLSIGNAVDHARSEVYDFILGEITEYLSANPNGPQIALVSQTSRSTPFPVRWLQFLAELVERHPHPKLGLAASCTRLLRGRKDAHSLAHYLIANKQLFGLNYGGNGPADRNLLCPLGPRAGTEDQVGKVGTPSECEDIIVELLIPRTRSGFTPTITLGYCNEIVEAICEQLSGKDGPASLLIRAYIQHLRNLTTPRVDALVSIP